MESRLSDSSFDILRRLDLFFGSGRCTSEVAQFFQEANGRIEFVAPDEEQPLVNQEVYQEYRALMEKHVDEFLRQEAMDAGHLLQVASEAVELGQQATFTALDYLLSLDDYDTFIDLVWSHGMTEGHVDEDD
jgi:hypothetical protein